ncbi:MAG: IclR family transcriptional regulator [Comamonadaceae bacterium]|nr:IclR family transcriptional regulator [Comamonadaceae bacterium]
MTSETPSRQVASVSRALQILELLIAAPLHELGVTEIARGIGVVKSSAHQLLSTLASHGFVETSAGSGRYRLGVGLMEAGAVASQQLGLGPGVLPMLEALVSEVGETCSLGVLVGTNISLLQRVEAQSVLRVDLKVGTRFPAQTSAIGRVILSEMAQEQRDQVLEQMNLPEHERQAFLQELDKVRQDGCAIVNNIPVEGIGAIAVAVRPSAQGPVAGLVVAAPAFRFNPEAWRAPLQRTAAMIAARGIRKF